jgi:phasin family protein
VLLPSGFAIRGCETGTGGRNADLFAQKKQQAHTERAVGMQVEDLIHLEIADRNIERIPMAHPRQIERDVNEASKATARKVADETSRPARAAAEAGAGAARAGADMVQRNAETAQHAWESGSRMAGQLVEQSIERFAHAFGISGEGAQQATQQSSRNLESMLQSGTILAGGMQSISRALFDFTRKRMEQNLHCADALLRCRTPQEMLAAQSHFMRDNLEDFVQSTRRIAEISMQMADEAASRISDASLAPR